VCLQFISTTIDRYILLSSVVLYICISVYHICFDTMAMNVIRIRGPPCPRDDVDIILEMEFPVTGRHRFTVLVSFLLVYMAYYDVQQNIKMWELELKTRLRNTDLTKAREFQTELLELGLHPTIFLTEIKKLMSRFPTRQISVHH